MIVPAMNFFSRTNSTVYFYNTMDICVLRFIVEYEIILLVPEIPIRVKSGAESYDSYNLKRVKILR